MLQALTNVLNYLKMEKVDIAKVRTCIVFESSRHVPDDSDFPSIS